MVPHHLQHVRVVDVWVGPRKQWGGKKFLTLLSSLPASARESCDVTLNVTLRCHASSPSVVPALCMGFAGVRDALSRTAHLSLHDHSHQGQVVRGHHGSDRIRKLLQRLRLRRQPLCAPGRNALWVPLPAWRGLFLIVGNFSTTNGGAPSCARNLKCTCATRKRKTTTGAG